MFKDRAEAGKMLSKKLRKYKNKNFIVIGLPRGGVPVAIEIARALHSPLNIIIVRKISSPQHPEYGLGAISEERTLVLDEKRMAESLATYKSLENSIQNEKSELKRRVKIYRKNKKLEIKNKNVILADDGLATGVTARAGVIAAKKLGAKYILFAAPVCAAQSIPELEKHADKVVCLNKPKHLISVASYYENFKQVKDNEVLDLLNQNIP